MPGPLGPIALAALANAIRVAGGIKKASTVNKVFAEGMAPPIVPRTQAQINAEGLAKIRQTLKIPEKGTPAANKISSQIKKHNASSSEKAGKASNTLSKKTYKK
jgi:hypothetical protein